MEYSLWSNANWNPAKIIGQNPYPLLSSLYKTLVLDQLG